jgi:hypothetical protein
MNWVVVALVLLLTGGITWVALAAVTRYCRRYPDLSSEPDLDEEFP